MRLAFAFFFATSLTLTACKSKKEPLPPSTVNGSTVSVTPSQRPKAPSKVSRNWELANVEVRCAEKYCPPQVGILFFMDGGVMDRCTATLISPNQILTTGHCDGEIKNGYFILGSGKKRIVRRLQDRVFKEYVPNANPDVETLAPAGLVFSLDQPIPDVSPLRVAAGRQENFDSLTAYVVNQDEPGGEKFKVESSVCHVRRHESIFPYDISETPDLIWGFDCKIVGGNSGSPMFAKGESDIQAVLQAITPSEKYIAEVREQLKREPTIYEKHSLMLSTNVRCLALPHTTPQTCTKFDNVERTWRFSEAQRIAGEKVMQRRAPERFAELFDFRTFSFALAGSVGFDQSFELFYLPICRKGERNFSEASFPSELVRYYFDEWATPIVESEGVRTSKASVVELTDKIVTFDTQWSEPFGPLLEDVEHPRRKWGNRFSIEIPRCAR